MPDYIIIGSTSLDINDILSDVVPDDLDLLVRPAEDYTWLYDLFPGQKLDLLKCPFFDEVLSLNDFECVLSLDNLYSLLHSHLFWKNKNGKYRKYMESYAYLQSIGRTLNRPLVNIFYEFWCNTKSPKDHIVLDKPAEDFFNDNVKRKFHHDKIHKDIAYNNEPAYMKILKPGSEVMCDETLFNDLSTFDKDLCIVEEVLVTSKERAIGFKAGYVHLITSLTRGWFADYALTRAPLYLGLLKTKPEADMLQYIKRNTRNYNV